MTHPFLLAYIGPGAGISVIGTAAAFIGSLIFAIVGFVWYPLKRLLGIMRRSQAVGQDRDEAVDPS